MQSGTGASGAGPLVLVCDDVEAIRRLVRINLELAGFAVEEAADGHEAMARLIDPDRAVPGVIVLDSEMAPYDGWWAIAAIRSHPRLDPVPVLLLTGSVVDPRRPGGERRGLRRLPRPSRSTRTTSWPPSHDSRRPAGALGAAHRLARVTPEQLAAAIRAALQSAVDAGDLAVAVPAEVRVERPRNRDHGDWSTNVALQLAKGAGIPPRDLATRARDPPRRRVPGVKAVEVAGPGFLNITLDAASAGELARSIVVAGPTYGHSTAESGRVVNLEFISANPTGPIHIGHTRWAALGDAMRRLLAAAGATVASEYYINDAGAQMDKFGASVLARARGEEPPEDGYPGEYVADRAAEVLAQRPDLLQLDPDTRVRRRPRPRVRGAARGDPAHPRRVRGALRRVVLRARAPRGRGGRARRRAAARAGARLRRGRCGVVAHHRLRRRQGPRAHPHRRQPDVLRRRRGVLPEQEGPRLRREGLPPRGRPPRLHQPAQGHRRLRRRRPASATSR